MGRKERLGAEFTGNNDSTGKRIWTSGGELGLFHLFLARSFLGNAVRDWTNKKMVRNGKKPTTTKELYAFFGLELEMSLVVLNDIKRYWSQKRFEGQVEFKSTMA